MLLEGQTGFDFGAFLNSIVNWATTTGIKIVIAIILMIVLFKVINAFTKKLYKRLEKKGADETISRVGTQVLRGLLKIIVIICIVGYLGFETASLSAVVASLGVGISLAVQGTLANFAGGVIIIIMRPFKIGDFITSNGQSGTVEDIKLFYTRVVTPDNKVVYVPNASLANNVIVNVSEKDTRRVDVVMSVAYSSNIELCKNLVKKVAANNELIFKDPDTFVEVSEYADSAINLTVRCWCNKGDYWTVYFYLLAEIKKAFDEAGVEIPFNQLDVTIKQ